MSNAKTTVTAIFIGLGVLYTQTQAGIVITDWKAWILPVAIAVFGYFAKDQTPTQ